MANTVQHWFEREYEAAMATLEGTEVQTLTNRAEAIDNDNTDVPHGMRSRVADMLRSKAWQFAALDD